VTENSGNDSDAIEFCDERDEVLAVVKNRNFEWEVLTRTLADGEERQIFAIFLPNGRNTRRVIVTPVRARSLLDGEFENWTILGDYIAYHDRSRGIIEALLQPIARNSGISHPAFLPGVIVEDSCSPDSKAGQQADEDIPEDPRGVLKRDWRIPVKAKYSTAGIEIRKATSALRGIADALQLRSPEGVSIFISELKCERHDEALAALERYSSTLLFQLELQFELSLTLARRRNAPILRRNSSDPVQPQELKPLANSYAEQPVSLYFYGKSATNMPLLQYLTYYQAIEFFFPSFSNSETLRRLRDKLRDPRFDFEDDANLQELALIISGHKRGFISEREQLRITIEACTDNEELLSYICDNETREEFFTKNTKIAGTRKISVTDRDKLIQQVTERIYTIRCRIVHSKEGGDTAQLKALLPVGTEADNLRHDILLLQFLAQKVIISGSRGRLI
jgi:hypothetical protein